MPAAEGSGRSSCPERNAAGRRRSLSGRAGFEAVFSRGARFRGEVLRIVWCANTLGVTRLGFSVPGRLGGSVERNRFKRRVRVLLQALPPGLDAVVGSVVPLGRASWESMARDAERFLAEAASQGERFSF